MLRTHSEPEQMLAWRVGAAAPLRDFQSLYVRFGSWLCENALTEVLRRRDFGKVAMQGDFSEISGFLSGRAPDADSGHLGRLCNWRRKHVFDDYALIPARSAWTSMMFMTRVRL